MSLWSRSTCGRVLGRIYRGYSWNLHESVLCAGGKENEDTCVGDGGSPLVCEHNGQLIPVGIVSWGVSCGEGYPGVYVNVPRFMPWIVETLATRNITLYIAD